jgi:hypothetical protein
MRAFEVHLNGKRLCLAGVGQDGVLTAIVGYVKLGGGRGQTSISVGGLINPAHDYVNWTNRGLKLGDELRLKITDTEKVDRPKSRQRHDPRQELAQKKRHTRKMVRELGWQIIAKPRKRGKD